MVDRVVPQHPKVVLRRIDTDEDPVAFSHLGFRGVPATVLVDGEGNYLSHFTGARGERELEELFSSFGL